MVHVNNSNTNMSKKKHIHKFMYIQILKRWLFSFLTFARSFEWEKVEFQYRYKTLFVKNAKII
jgi:hypothetical protein